MLGRGREESSQEKIKIISGKRSNTVNINTTFLLKFQQKVELLVENTSLDIKQEKMYIYIYVYMVFVLFKPSKDLEGRCEGWGGHDGGKTSK